MTRWKTRPETPADTAAVRRVVEAAFPTALEADLVDALRTDPAWIPGLSWLAEDGPEDGDGEVVAYALLTRCRVGTAPALALGPVAVAPEQQNRGAGGAVTRAALQAARAMGEPLVVVLGHPHYYPRFGFVPASDVGITIALDVPEGALMALALDPDVPPAAGQITYPPPFGV